MPVCALGTTTLWASQGNIIMDLHSVRTLSGMALSQGAKVAIMGSG
jgi:hypothetical protein